MGETGPRGHLLSVEKLFHRSLLDTPSIKDATLAEKILKDSLEEAINIQKAMLPARPLVLPSVEIRHKYRPARVVSGDFSDYFSIGNSNLLGLYLGDVVGKGMAAALYAALASGTLCGINKGGETPNAVLAFLNRRLCARNVAWRYCAIQYAVFDPASGELRFSNAGLSPRPVHISEAGCCELGDGGFPCGMFNEVAYDLYFAQVSPGDTVLFSTDGIIEAHDPSAEHFGVERLFEVCHANRRETTTVLLERIFQAVDAFAAADVQHDDMTVAALRLT